MKISGIYLIRNIQNDKKYVGSSRHIYSRRNGHFSALKLGNHSNYKLQKEYNNFGANYFEFIILENVPDINKLCDREQYWIDTLNPEYNLSKIANNTTWKFRSEESRKSVSEAVRKRQSGRKQSQEEKDKRASSIKKFWATHPAKSIPQKMKEHLSKINTGSGNPNWGLKRKKKTRELMSQNIPKVLYTFKSPDGKEFTFKNLSKAPIPVPYGALRNLYRGITNDHKGWTFVKSEKVQ